MTDALGPNASLKLDLMFEGIRYSTALGAAAEHSFPNFYPYRFAAGEHDPTGNGKVEIPYLLSTEAGTLVRVKGAGDSAWQVTGSQSAGYELIRDDAVTGWPVEFAPLPRWMREQTSDGFPMAQTGLSLHGDMGVINIAPGCEYFLQKVDKQSMRCTFCAYGAPDKRTQDLGQVAGITSLPQRTYHRIQETLAAALRETELHHLYLVGGSMLDWREEGRRFIDIARAVGEVNSDVPVICGSGALPKEAMDQLYDEQLVQGVCFNLEVWSKTLFEQICPGKNRYVGYDQWIAALEYGVGLWGKGRVYTAMVAGIELEPEYNLSWSEAADLAIAGAEDLCRRGIIPIYSLYWPVGGRDHPEYMSRLRAYFERLMLGYQEIRTKYDLQVWDGFMCQKCAYMQMECDMDLERGLSQ